MHVKKTDRFLKILFLVDLDVPVLSGEMETLHKSFIF